jgi:hypothetical protein
MYRIDTGQARTDIYKNSPLDFSEISAGVSQAAKAKAVVKATENKAAQEHMDDIMTNIGKANQIAYMPKDSQLIADKTRAITDYVEKNVGALKKGDIQATLGYQQLAGDLYSFAEQSKNFREKMESVGKDYDSYRPEAQAAYLNTYSTATAGQHNFDPSVLKKNTNYMDRVEKVHRPYAIAISQRDDSGRKYTNEQARGLIRKDLLTDEKYHEQAVYDFNRATPEQRGDAKDAYEFYENLYSDLLTFDDTGTKGTGRGGAGSGGEKAPAVSSEYKITGPNSGVLVWDYVKPPDNPYQTFSVGSLRPGVIHNEDGSLWMEGFTLPDKDGDSEMRRIPDGETRDFLQTKLLTNIKDLRAGKAPSNFEHKVSDFKKSAAAGHAAAEKTRAETKANKAVKLTPDEEALKFTKDFPNDPRTPAIKANLKSKGIQ